MRIEDKLFWGEERTLVLLTIIVTGIIVAGVIFVIGSLKRSPEVLLLEDGPKVENCGSSWECLIEAARECNVSQAVTKDKKSQEVYHEIRGIENAYCVYYHELVESSAELGKNPKNGTCQLRPERLSRFISDWREDNVNPEDFTRFKCEGTFLFGYEFSQEEGLLPSSTGASPSDSSSSGSGGDGSGSGEEESSENGGSSSPPPPSSTPPPPPGGSSGGGEDPESCTLSGASSVSLPPGASSSLSVNGYKGDPSLVIWSVANTNIVTIDPSAGSTVFVEAVSVGKTQITVTDTAFGQSCQVIINMTVQQI